MENSPLKRTPLYPLHVEEEARLVSFAGYEMPVQYSTGIKQEHLHVRQHAGLFDISHMGQIRLSGNNVAQWLDSLVPSNITDLQTHKQCYTVFTNEQGGILDDLMITNAGDYFFLVINAACKEKDINYLQEKLSNGCHLDELTDNALLALQGPEAKTVMQRLCPEATELGFMTGAEFLLNDVKCFINRCGYTGEDGFEISVPNEHVEYIAKSFLAEDGVKMIGLGARDSLRLEAGYCLYGHDLNDSTSPVEANLNWTISKARLQENDNAYPGMEIIREQLQQGTTRCRVGIISDGKAPIREGIAILNVQEENIGTITSGGFGPSIGKPIAMAYIDQQYTAAETPLIVKVRDRVQQVQVVTLPFVEHKYQRQ